MKSVMAQALLCDTAEANGSQKRSFFTKYCQKFVDLSVIM